MDAENVLFNCCLIQRTLQICCTVDCSSHCALSFYFGAQLGETANSFSTIWRENLFWRNSFKSVAICARDICTTWILSARIILRIDCCLVDSIKPNVVISFLFFFDRDFSCKSVLSLIKIICFYFLSIKTKRNQAKEEKKNVRAHA